MVSVKVGVRTTITNAQDQKDKVIQYEAKKQPTQATRNAVIVHASQASRSMNTSSKCP